ncbi:uncharacterized protein BJ171DRAFT_239060 [Polychytrium aggregatum]|uniref:uncharacterized protein n=1 Tax=Polychytrium aggregatum TaxID=110093 RepID=UPI0022FE5B7C|nr:uncharacterized protein BJ171DRAFT_239060 [Polychytrium aggregatum]KAI9208383.1 hypothetical protein BJ171DRAFT_239060 [Polychytrium aggregatum]
MTCPSAATTVSGEDDDAAQPLLQPQASSESLASSAADGTGKEQPRVHATPTSAIQLGLDQPYVFLDPHEPFSAFSGHVRVRTDRCPGVPRKLQIRFLGASVTRYEEPQTPTNLRGTHCLFDRCIVLHDSSFQSNQPAKTLWQTTLDLWDSVMAPGKLISQPGVKNSDGNASGSAGRTFSGASDPKTSSGPDGKAPNGNDTDHDESSNDSNEIQFAFGLRIPSHCPASFLSRHGQIQYLLIATLSYSSRFCGLPLLTPTSSVLTTEIDVYKLAALEWPLSVEAWEVTADGLHSVWRPLSGFEVYCPRVTDLEDARLQIRLEVDREWVRGFRGVDEIGICLVQRSRYTFSHRVPIIFPTNPSTESIGTCHHDAEECIVPFRFFSISGTMDIDFSLLDPREKGVEYVPDTNDEIMQVSHFLVVKIAPYTTEVQIPIIVTRFPDGIDAGSLVRSHSLARHLGPDQVPIQISHLEPDTEVRLPPSAEQPSQSVAVPIPTPIMPVGSVDGRASAETLVFQDPPVSHDESVKHKHSPDESDPKQEARQGNRQLEQPSESQDARMSPGSIRSSLLQQERERELAKAERLATRKAAKKVRKSLFMPADVGLDDHRDHPRGPFGMVSADAQEKLGLASRMAIPQKERLSPTAARSARIAAISTAVARAREGPGRQQQQAYGASAMLGQVGGSGSSSRFIIDSILSEYEETPCRRRRHMAEDSD